MPFNVVGREDAVLAFGVEIEDHSLPMPDAERHGPKPSSVLEHWAHEQLAVTGNGPPVHFIILDASVNAERLPVEHGFNAMFKDQQDRKRQADDVGQSAHRAGGLREDGNG